MSEQKKITVDESFQDIKSEGLGLPLSLLPQTVRRIFVNNIFTRTFAQLLGWTGTKNVLLTATESGYLKVSSTGTVNEHNVVKSGNAPDAYGAAEDLANLCVTVDIFTWDKACYVIRSIDGVTYGSDIEIPANAVYSFDCDTRYIKIKNKAAGQVCRFQFVGWY
jgi:hypothetical protein